MWSSLSGKSLLFLDAGSLQNLETAHESLIDGHQSTGVVEFTAVVYGTENSDELSVSKEFVAIINDLMSSANQVNIVSFSKT